MQKRSGGNAAMVALVVALAGFGLLLLKELILSFKDYTPRLGMAGSPWVGLRNYQRLFSSRGFTAVLANTLVFHLLLALLVFVIALAASTLLHRMKRGGFLRGTLAMLMALPALMPAQIYAYWWILALDSATFTSAEAMRYVLPLMAALKYAGIPVLTAHVLDRRSAARDGLLPVRTAALFALATLALVGSGFFELTWAVQNPLSYAATDTLATYSYRSGLIQMSYGAASAVDVMRTLLCALGVAILFAPLRTLARQVFRSLEAPQALDAEASPGPLRAVAPSALALLILMGLYLLPAIVQGASFDLRPLGGRIFAALPGYLLLSMAAALVSTALAILLGGFAGHGGVQRLSGAVLLVAITVLAAKAYSIAGYLQMRQMGLINTVWAVLLPGCFSAGAVWTVVGARRAGLPQRGPQAAALLGGLFLVQMALVYSNVTPSMLYSTQPDRYPLLQIAQLMQGSGAASGTISLAFLLVSLPPLLALPLCALLPGSAQLAILSAGIKNS